MDAVSHFIIPFAGALIALGFYRKTDGEATNDGRRSRLALALTFGVAGVAPDLDSLYGFFRHTEGLYFLQHRGLSHSLIGAPLHGVIGAGLVALTARLFPRHLGWLHWRTSYIWIGATGGFTHLLLDVLTYGGIPLFWPLSLTSHSLNLYPWLLIWAFPVSGVLTLLFVLRKITPRRLVQFTAVLVVIMLLNGGLRFESRPELREGEQAFPRASYREWIVLTPDEEGDGWYLQVYEDGVPREPQWHNKTRILPGSEEAVELARDTNAYRGLVLNTFGPIVIETAPHEDQGWLVNFTAVVPRMDAAQDPPWTPTHPDVRAWGLLELHVDGERVQTLRHGW